MLIGVLSLSLTLAPPSGPSEEPLSLEPRKLRVTPELAAAAVPPPRPVAVDPIQAEAAALRLSPLEGGGFAYVGIRPGERFDATVRSDGVVEFELDRLVQGGVQSACLVALCVSQGQRAPKGPSRRSLALSLFAVALAAVGGAAGNAPDDVGYAERRAWEEKLRGSSLQQPSVAPAPMVGAVGRYGYLPEPKSAMIDFLDRTFELRLKMARAAILRRIEAQERELPRRLHDAWSASSLPLPDRRAAILALWDELEPAQSPHVDPEVEKALVGSVDEARQRAADRARAAIRAFVQRHAPASSNAAFTAEELRRFNAARPVEARFDPYLVPTVP